MKQRILFQTSVVLAVTSIALFLHYSKSEIVWQFSRYNIDAFYIGFSLLLIIGLVFSKNTYSTYTQSSAIILYSLLFILLKGYDCVDWCQVGLYFYNVFFLGAYITTELLLFLHRLYTKRKNNRKEI